MAKKTTLSVVKRNDKAQQQARQELRQRRDREEESWKLTRQEVKYRVHEIRADLKTLDGMIAGLHFDIIQPDTPFSLHGHGDDIESSTLAERLNPMIAGRWKRLQKHLYDTDQVDLADNDLGPMKWALADIAFGIGVLAGAIFTGASEREINRLERGLVHAVSARPEVKD